MRSRQHHTANAVPAALRRQRSIFIAVGLFSGVLNVLALTGAFYMLQIYDRVLPSGSLPTLIGLSILMAGLYFAYGLLDFIRARLLSRIGMRFDRLVSARIFALLHDRTARRQSSDPSLQPIRDLDQLRGFLSGSGPVALFDVPWMPLYLAVIYLLHPMLGLFAIAGTALLLILTLLAELLNRAPLAKAAAIQRQRLALADAARRNGEVVQSMGMAAPLTRRWHTINDSYLSSNARSGEVSTAISTISKLVRLLLQSGVLGLGAYLAIAGEVSPGAIIAGSITLSRALAPIDSLIAHWRGFVAARQGYHRLVAAFAEQDQRTLPDDATELPPPVTSLRATELVVTPPGARQPAIRGVDFALLAGDGLGIIGPTASGKSTLARALVGVWQPSHPRSTIRLDGAALGQWSSDALGRHIGYLPQEIELFDGTIAENIARFDPAARDEEIIAAAKSAGCHDMIVQFERGYQTEIGEGGTSLSGGQRQRIALARALFRQPFLIVLDEPNANLDQPGEQALAAAIVDVRRRGGIAVVVAHRPSALQALNKLLVIANGQTKDIGPRDEVLRRILANSKPAGQPTPVPEPSNA